MGGGGGGGWGKSQKKKKICKGKCQEKKFVQRTRERKKIHAVGRSNCEKGKGKEKVKISKQRIILCFWETELESCHSSLSTYSSSDSNRTQNIELGYDKVELLSAIELGSENHTRARQNIELGVCGIHTLFSGGRRGYPYSSSIKTNRARNGWLKGN